jgi:hypothetical protein
VKQIRKRLTYANVMSTIAVFFVVGGASAFAASELAKNSVGTKQLKGNAVTTGKIKKEAVAAAKIKKGAVGTGKLGAGAVTGEKLAGDAVDASKLGKEAVTSEKLGKAAVTSEKLAATAVDASKLGKEAVTNEKLAANAVNGSKVADGSLTGADLDQASLNAVKAANVYGLTFKEVGGPEVVKVSDPGIKSGGCFLVCAVEFPRDVSACSYVATSTDLGSGSGEPAMAETFLSGSNKKTVLVVMWNDEGNLIAHDFAMTVVCPTTS